MVTGVWGNFCSSAGSADYFATYIYDEKGAASLHPAPQSGEGGPRCVAARWKGRRPHGWPRRRMPPCMFGRPNQPKLRGASRPVATGLDADGRDRMPPGCLAPWWSKGPSVLRLLSSTDDREHVPHARQGSVRTRDQGQV